MAIRWILPFIVMLAACSQTSHQNEIHFAIAQAALNLDPRYATDATSERINRLIYQPLVDFDQNSKPIPALANWQLISPTEYRFTLKSNRKPFHHHRILTAHDVKATYDSLLQRTDSPHHAEFSNLIQIQVVNDQEVLFKLQSADTHFPSKLIIGILPKDLIDKNHDFSHAPIGNGLLRFMHWNNQLKLQRISDQQIISLQEVKDPTVRVLKLIRGETDLLQGDLPPELVKYLQKKPGIQVTHSIGANFSYLGLNLQDSVLKNHKIRQAICYAINTKAIINQVMVAATRPATVILPPEHYAGNNTLQPYPYNPKLAKQLLVEAGVELPLKLVYKTSTDAQRVRLATILQAQMHEVGIELEIRSLDWGTFFADVKTGNFQLYGLTWVGIKTPEIYAKTFASTSLPPNGFNRGRYADSELDMLLSMENWPAVTQHIHQTLPYIPLWYEGQFTAMQKNISGYSAKADGNWDDLATIHYAH